MMLVTAGASPHSYQVSFQGVHSQLDNYLGESRWGFQLRGAYRFYYQYFDFLAGLGFRQDGGEGLALHTVNFPLLFGPYGILGRFGFFARSGIETNILIYAARDDDFFVPESSTLKTFQISWPAQAGIDYWLNQSWRIGLVAEMNYGLTATATPRSGTLKSRNLSSGLQFTGVF